MSRTQHVKFLRRVVSECTIQGYNGRRDGQLCHSERGGPDGRGCFNPCDVTIDGDPYCFGCADRIAGVSGA